MADLCDLLPAQEFMLTSVGRARVNAARVTFDIASDPGGDPRVASPAPHEDFQSDFRSELDRLDEWSRLYHWLPRFVPRLQVSVSGKYRISKSLVPAWYDSILSPARLVRR